MHELIASGFREEEIHRVVPDPRLRPFVPAALKGEDGFFGVDVASRLDLSLSGKGIRVAEAELLRARDGFEVRWVDEIELLGIVRPAGEVTAFPGASGGNVFGTIGAGHLAGRVVAFDTAGPHMAVSSRPVRPLADGIRLGLSGRTAVPVTDDVVFRLAPERAVTTLLSTDSESRVMASLVEELPRKALGKDGVARLRLPGGHGLEVDLEVAEEPPRYAEPVADGPVELVLGIDVLRRFLCVFDFPGKEVRLRPYPGALDDDDGEADG